MSEQPTVPAEVRASLPPVVQAYLAFPEGQIAPLLTQGPPPEPAMANLRAQMAEPQARDSRNSGGSSRPP